MVLSVIARCGLAFTLSACATIVTGGHQSVTFNSNPDQATVTVDGKVIGKTPATMSLKKKSGQTLTFEKDGYQPVSMPFKADLNPWFLGNVIIGGLLGSTTDSLSGAIYQYSPNHYMVTLQPADSTSAELPAAAVGASAASNVPAAPADQIASLETHTALTTAQKQKDYIVRNYDALVNDLKSGPAAKPGEHLASLLSLLNVKPSLEYDAIKRMRAMSVEYPDGVEFADHVLEEFGR